MVMIGSHYVILPFVPVTANELPLFKLEHHTWRKLHQEMCDHIIITIDLGLLHIFPNMLDCHLKTMLGFHLFDVEPSPARPDHKKKKVDG